MAPDLPDPVWAAAAAAITQSRAHPVSTVEAGLGAAIDHVLNSQEASYSKSNRLRASLKSVQAQAERDALTGLRTDRAGLPRRRCRSPSVDRRDIRRSEALAAARARHPTRFATDHDPKILDLPPAAWINEPKKTEEDTAA